MSAEMIDEEFDKHLEKCAVNAAKRALRNFNPCKSKGPKKESAA